MRSQAGSRECVRTSSLAPQHAVGRGDAVAVPRARLTSSSRAKDESIVEAREHPSLDHALNASPRLDGGSVTGQAVANESVSLRTLLASLPPETRLPVGWLLARLDDRGTPPIQKAEVELLSAEEFGTRRVPKRSADWVREQCVAGLFATAYKEGGRWVIPSDELELRTIEREQEEGQPRLPSGTRDGRLHGRLLGTVAGRKSRRRYARW